MKKVAIIIGSQSDLKQCVGGLKLLQDHPEIIVNVFVRSQHRNTLDLQQLLQELVQLKYDVIIAGAGWANHLTGCVDAYLRYTLRDATIPVIGVAFSDPKNNRHTRAAVLSMTEVPGTQVIYKKTEAIFIGPEGFWGACQLAINGKLPKIELPQGKEALDLNLDTALKMGQELLSK